MLDTLVVWIVGFTDSQVRAFRHTSTLAGVKLVSALITIANYINTEIDNTQVLYEYSVVLLCSVASTFSIHAVLEALFFWRPVTSINIIFMYHNIIIIIMFSVFMYMQSSTKCVWSFIIIFCKCRWFPCPVTMCSSKWKLSAGDNSLRKQSLVWLHWRHYCLNKRNRKSTNWSWKTWWRGFSPVSLCTAVEMLDQR